MSAEHRNSAPDRHDNAPEQTADSAATRPGRPARDDQVPTGGVVAGLDGTDKDRTVLAFAVRQAEILGAPLHLLMAQEVHAGLVGAWEAGFIPMGLESELGQRSSRALDGTLPRLAADHPAVTVTASQPWGTPSQALVDASDQARLVVVGSGRKGTLERILLGTTSLNTAMHASCPVVVVGDDPGDVRRPVVVGVDGSDHSIRAATVAGDEASRRGVALVVVTTWWLEVVDGIVVTEEGSPQWERVESGYRKMIDQVLRPIRDKHPDLAIEIDLRNARAVGTLLERAGDAGLVVVGGRGHGGFAGMALGSVSHKVLQRCLIPVAIVRAQAHTD
ncbi:MAG: universal stress protein [Intrasporangium sp.]|uniref:universal stress protein n=1 Tax=Intrasporangium sp. TaxID=1925024 RepID=UPI0026496182|nr:universal stress protein [Intrasporangium sp.]MDN5794299.1 universal stress protein [Intrasporangium sp.]